MPAKKYRMELTSEECDHLFERLGRGERPVRELTRARVLMKVDKVPDGLAWTDKRTVETLDLLDLLDASFFVEVKLIGNGVAMDAQLASRSASAFSLPSLQKKEHVETALDLSVFLFAGEPLKLID